MKFVAIAALALASLFAWQVRAEDHPGHAENHEMYKGWQRPNCSSSPFSPTSCSCCNDNDCRPTVGYLMDNGSWMVRVGPGNTEESWAEALPKTFLPRHEDGRCHVCAIGRSVICFRPCDPRI